MHCRQLTQHRSQHLRLRQAHWRPDHPLRRPHKVFDVNGIALQCRHDLYAGRTVTDDGDPAAGGHDVVVPPRRVHDIALECVQARDVRCERVMQHAGRGDHEVCFQLCAVRRGDLPCAAIEYRRHDFGLQSDPIVETELSDDVSEVALNLDSRREHSGPVGFGRERELVELRRYVTRQTGVAVPMPDTADVCALLQNREVVKSCALQRDRGGDPCDAGADDDDPRLPCHRRPLACSSIDFS